MRVIHTAGLRLDCSYVSAGYGPPFGQRRRDELRAVAAAITNHARQWPADALLVTGNLVDAQRVSPDTLEWLAATFAAIAPIPIVITPGPLDPHGPNSPYVLRPWPDNVHVFRDSEWTELDLSHAGLVIRGCAWNEGGAELPPCDLPEPSNHRTVIAAAYAGHAAPALADTISAHYVALGHDGRTSHNRNVGHAGPPQGRDLAEDGLRHYLEITIKNGETTIEPVPGSKSIFAKHKIDVTNFVSIDEVLHAVTTIAKDSEARPIAQVTLEGPRTFSNTEWPGDLYARAAAPFDYLELVDETYPGENYQTLANQPSPTGAFLTRINSEIMDAPDPAHRRMLIRARTIGLAALRGNAAPLPMETD